MSVRPFVHRSSLRHISVERLLLGGILVYLLAGRLLPSWTASAEEPQQAIQAITQPVSTFTYQGRIETDGVPVTGSYDIKFVLWDDEELGSIKGVLDGEQVAVSNGLFAVPLDYGLGAFDGSPRWLEVLVRPDGNGPFESMGRRELTATPYAIVAATLALPSYNETVATSAALSIENGGAGPQAYGIRGVGGPGSAGVYGNGGVNGVVGETSSGTGSGVYGEATTNGNGVSGRALGTGNGVFGNGFTSGNGVYGITSGERDGVYGYSPSGHGVFGSADEGQGVAGDSISSFGVYGQTQSSSVAAIRGIGGHIGVEGIGPNGGLYGQTSSTTASAVLGSNLSAGAGVYGKSTSGDGTWGEALLAGKSGIVGKSAGGPSSNFAGYFIGNVEVQGMLVASAKPFKIDHPLDPLNKYLQHTAIESPDMKNLYDGIITTGANGLATVVLPDYFEALNRDFRYQLTIVGGDSWARARIASGVSGNAFVIESDQPGVTVSWQVTGIRHDAFAEAHRTIVEVDKIGDEIGTCIEPTACPAP